MRIHAFSLPYEYREVGRRYTRGDGASSQELFLNKPVSKGSKIAEVEVRMEELFCIALKRSKVSLWHAEVHGEGDGKMVEGRGTGWRDVAQKYWKGEESGRQLSTNYIARSCFCLPPSPPLSSPARNVSRNVFDNVSRPWKHIAAQNFRNQPNNRAGFSQLFRNEEDSTMSNSNYELTFSLVNSRDFLNVYEISNDSWYLHEKNSYRAVYNL